MLRRVLPLVLLSAALLAPSARAQLDPGYRFRLVQDGEEAGQVYVPPGQDACRYTEYWFVYEGFTFVSARSRASFSVEPDERSEDLQGFLREMWTAHPDGRLFEAVSTETRRGCP